MLAPRLCAAFDEENRTKRAEHRIDTDWTAKECGKSQCGGNCVAQFYSKAKKKKVDDWRLGWSTLSLADRHECLMRYYDTYGDYSTVTIHDIDGDGDETGLVTLRDSNGQEIVAEVSDPKKTVVKQYKSACSRDFRISLTITPSTSAIIEKTFRLD